jgi:hypothetical protein
MIRLTVCTLAIALQAAALALPAQAKLDPPSPEEQAAAAKKKALEQEQMKRAQEDLSRVQDEVAARYRREHPQTQGTQKAAGETPKEELPRAVRDVPREAGPHGRDEPGAEAHSAPAGTPQPAGKR